jgi:hypothetical protein
LHYNLCVFGCGVWVWVWVCVCVCLCLCVCVLFILPATCSNCNLQRVLLLTSSNLQRVLLPTSSNLQRVLPLTSHSLFTHLFFGLHGHPPQDSLPVCRSTIISPRIRTSPLLHALRVCANAVYDSPPAVTYKWAPHWARLSHPVPWHILTHSGTSPATCLC